MHQYTRIWFPGLREARFVRRHRRLGHEVVHCSTTVLMPGCWWDCLTCGAEWFC